MSTCTYVVGDTRDVLAHIPDGTVDLVMTSPPFLALRSYLPADHADKHREIGSETTPAAFVSMLLGLSAEWRRVLTPHGTLAVELGDTYSGSGGGGGDYLEGGMREGQQQFAGSAASMRESNAAHWRQKNTDKAAWPLPKSLALIPEAYRLALAYGLNPLTGEPSPAGRWRVRNNVTWCRPNPPVGALGDKFRPSTSDLVIACTSGKRWFDLDAVRRPVIPDKVATRGGKWNGDDTDGPERSGRRLDTYTSDMSAGAPPLDHWVIPPGGYSGSHYAVFPVELCRIPVQAMCPRRVCRTCGTPSRRQVDTKRRAPADDSQRVKHANGERPHGGRVDRAPEVGWEYDRTTTSWSSCGCPGADGIRLDGWHTGTGWRPGIVLDPFGGSGTVGVVATGLGRDALLVDFDERNLHLARERVGMFLAESRADALGTALRTTVEGAA